MFTSRTAALCLLVLLLLGYETALAPDATVMRRERSEPKVFLNTSRFTGRAKVLCHALHAVHANFCLCGLNACCAQHICSNNANSQADTVDELPSTNVR